MRLVVAVRSRQLRKVGGELLQANDVRIREAAHFGGDAGRVDAAVDAAAPLHVPAKQTHRSKIRQDRCVFTFRGKKYWIGSAAAILALSTVVAVAVSSYRAIDKELTQAALSRRSAVAYLAATTLAEKFDRLSDVGVALATRVRFRELVAAGRWNEAIEILKAVPQDFTFVDRIQLLDPGGTVMTDIPASGARGRNYAYREWYQGVKAGWQTYVSAAYRRTELPQVDVFAVAVPISGKDAVTGILLLEVRLDRFFDWVERIESPRGESIFVVDRAGKLAFPARSSPSSDAELVDFSEAPGVARVLGGRVGVELAYSPFDKEDVIAAHVPVGGHGWGVVAQQPTRLAFEQRNLLLGLLRVAYALAALLCVTAVYLAARIAGERERVKEEGLVKSRLEARVTERTAQLEAANREHEAFSYSIAHDLRTPLRAIDGFSRILVDEHSAHLPAEAQRQLGVVRSNARKMGRLIDDLLGFARLARQPLKKSVVDMAALVRACLDELGEAREGRAVSVSVAELPPAAADAAMLKQVWLNLLSNALKYTTKRPDASVQIGSQPAGGEIAYYVSDNGVGFDMEYADKLFGVFQRLHRAEDYEGTGVGLAIVAHIVQRHGGRVWTHAELGRGATFYFTLGGAG
jgi:signal transduction histidine kinase